MYTALFQCLLYALQKHVIFLVQLSKILDLIDFLDI